MDPCVVFRLNERRLCVGDWLHKPQNKTKQKKKQEQNGTHHNCNTHTMSLSMRPLALSPPPPLSLTPVSARATLLESPRASPASEMRARALGPSGLGSASASGSSGSESASKSAHGDVFFVARHARALAVKQQRIRWPRHVAADRAYRELRVLLQLRRLAERGLCANFVRLEEWFKGE